MNCAVQDCPMGATHEALLSVNVIKEAILPKERGSYKPAKIKPGVEVCKEHTGLFAHDILTEEKWTQISLEIHKKKGSVFLDRDNLGVEWVLIKD